MANNDEESSVGDRVVTGISSQVSTASSGGGVVEWGSGCNWSEGVQSKESSSDETEGGD